MQGITSTHTVTQPTYKPEELTTTGIILDFFKEKIKDIAKIFGTTVFWASQATPNLPPAAQAFGKSMGDFKNFVGATEVPKKAVETHEAFSELCTSVKDLTGQTGSWSKVGAAGRKLFKNLTGLTSNVLDGVNFGSNFIPIDLATKNVLGGVGFVATAGSAGNGAVEQIEKLAKTEATDTKRQTLYWINLARDISFFALGVFGLGFMLTATAVIPWVMAACSTAGLVLSLIGYFYEKRCDPEKKGKNLNPEIVVENAMARRAHETSLAAI